MYQSIVVLSMLSRNEPIKNPARGISSADGIQLLNY